MPRGPLGGPRPAAKTDIVVYVSVNEGSAFNSGSGNELDNEDIGRLEENKKEFLDRYIWKDVRYISNEKASDLLGGASIGESLAFRHPGERPFDKRTLNNMKKHSESNFDIKLNEDSWVVIPI